MIIYSTTIFVDEATIKSALFNEIGDLIGQNSAQDLSNTLDRLGVFDQSVWASVLSISVLVFTATTVFTTMQNTLNSIFHVKANPKGFGIVKMIRDRLLSLGLLLGVAFILLVSLSVNAAISSFTNYISHTVGHFSSIIAIVFSFVVTLGVITLLFAIIFKYLPDVQLKWRDVWKGSIITAILFVIGKYGISFYIGTSNAANLYEAAGGLIVIMLWVFYASLIFFFGATFTYSYVSTMNHYLEPSEYAVQIKQTIVENKMDNEEIPPSPSA